MDRKLASIQRILKIEPIENADSIEKITVLGWNCVSRKGTFKVNDLCCYFEIDSLLKRAPWNDFLFKGSDAEKQEVRLRTIRLRGQVSQGLCIPLEGLFEIEKILENANLSPDKYLVGLDISDILKVTKYEAPIPAQLAGKILGRRPEFVIKTDETRIQAEPQILERYKGKEFFVSEKIDGSSCSIFLRDGEFGVCSRNLNIKEDKNNSFWKIARELDIKNKLIRTGKNIVLQGELYGEGIQKNKYKIKGQALALFNIFDIDKHEFLCYNDFINASYGLKISTVPMFSGTLILNHSVEDMVKFATGKSLLNPEVRREGIVLRPLIETRDEDLGRLSFKIINPDFLIKYGE